MGGDTGVVIEWERGCGGESESEGEGGSGGWDWGVYGSERMWLKRSVELGELMLRLAVGMAN